LLRDPTNTYFARSRDPDGTLHGVLGQKKYGYFEASPNHDAIALRIVDDADAEKIMVQTDELGAKIRPNTFMIPNTDAGGGRGYDDMLCSVNGTACSGIFTYGTWVNGGFWSTQEARAILAYFRTNRPDAAARSMETLLTSFISTWRMDAPLPNFGTTVWSDIDINLTIDAFGHGAAMIRGIFEYIFTSTTLTFVPHAPDNITALTQKFGVRWGAYRLFISTKGFRSSGINAVSINGAAASAPHTFNATSMTLDYAALPTPSAAALAAMESDVLTGGDAIYIAIEYKVQPSAASLASSNEPRKPKVVPASVGGTVRADHHQAPSSSASQAAPGGAALWLRADDLAATLKADDPVTHWAGANGTASAVAGAGGNPPPTFVPATGSGNATVPASVRFSRTNQTGLFGSLVLAPTKTILAALKDQGSDAIYCSIFADDTYRGLAVMPTNCEQGWPTAPTPCNGSSARVVAIDWLGSSDYGWQDINNRRTVVAVVYDKTLQGSPKASSYVDGCSQHSGADPQAVPVPEGASTSFRVGLRGDPVAYDRFFDGDLHELLVYNRTLSPDDLLAAQQYLASKWGTPVPTGVGGDCPNKPIHPLDCTALKSDATVAPSAEEIAAVTKFQSAAVAAGLAKSVPAGMAGAALAFMAGFDSRCQQLNNGTLQQLRRPSSTLASVNLLLTSANNYVVGLNNLLANYKANYGGNVGAQKLASLWTPLDVPSDAGSSRSD